MKIHWTDPSKAPLPGAPVAMQQHPRYGAACIAWGRDAQWAAISHQGAPVGGALALIRQVGRLGGAALISRGPVWVPDATGRTEALKALRRDAPVTGLRALFLTAEDTSQTAPLSAAGLVQVQTPMHVAELDLTAPDLVRRAAQSVKWRNRLVVAEASGLRIRRTALPPDPNHWLLRNEAAQQRAHGYRGLPPAFAAAWASTAKDAAQLFVAHTGGDPLAAMLVLIHAPSASYHIGWSGPEGRALNAHNLILWRATTWLAARGIARLDLGTVNTEDAPGLARFKIGAGAAVRPLGGAWLGAPGTGALAAIQSRRIAAKARHSAGRLPTLG